MCRLSLGGGDIMSASAYIIIAGEDGKYQIFHIIICIFMLMYCHIHMYLLFILSEN